VEQATADMPLSPAEESRKLRHEAEQVRAGLLFTLFALMEVRSNVWQALEQSRDRRRQARRQAAPGDTPRDRLQ
jgi:hypothetical protein